jgi:1-acyl-sn-glycerol-3-phosphate acyltransferase
MAAIRRPIRFVMDHRIYRMPVIGFVFRHSRTIPIAPAKEDAAQKEAAFVEVARALGEGELIGLFPEGKITHTGELNHFRYGVGRIVAETPVPVIPLALRGLWGSFFSRRYGPAMSKPSLLRLFSRIGLVAGEPVAPEIVTPDYLQELVAALVSDD